jgi:HK97 family phage portal protein
VKFKFNPLRLFSRKSTQDPLAAFLEVFRSHLMAKTGTAVSLETALQVSVVFACLRVLGEGVAQVPWELLQETDSPDSDLPMRRRAKDHPLWDVMTRRPNVWQTSFEFRECITWHAGLMGHAFVFLNRVGLSREKMRVAEMIPMNPGLLHEIVQNPDHTLTYRFRSAKTGEIKDFAQESIWHIRGPSWDGVHGLNVLKLARDSIGLAIATEETHAKLHANGVSPSGIYTVDGKLEPEQYKQLKTWLEEEYAGGENKGKPFILDMNAKFVPNVLTGVDAQHLETRRYQIEEVCRWFRIMPIMIGFSDKTTTFASAEAMFLAHLTHTLMPLYARLEGSAGVALLSEADAKAGYYNKFRERVLLRGAMKDTADYLTKLKQAGIITANEARADLDRDPVKGGDKLESTVTPKQPAPQGDEDPSAQPKD